MVETMELKLERYYDPGWCADDGSDVLDRIQQTVWDYISVED